MNTLARVSRFQHKTELKGGGAAYQPPTRFAESGRLVSRPS